MDLNTSILITEKKGRKKKAVLRRSTGVCTLSNAKHHEKASTFEEYEIILPDEKDFKHRRRSLQQKNAERCSSWTGVCLLTSMDEVTHMHGRSLSSSSSSYATLTFDAYGIESATGYVDFEATTSSDTSSTTSTTTEVDDTSGLEYDEFGCLVESGYVTVAYPLTVKHCFRFVETKTCGFSLDGSNINTASTTHQAGYSLAITEADYSDKSHDIEGGSGFFVSTDTHCSNDVSNVIGFCECGSGLKIAAGECASLSLSTCESICWDYAAENGLMAIDLHEHFDTRVEKKFDMDSLLTSDFFEKDEVVEGSSSDGYYVGVQDNVYYSMRLAYRRETPSSFGLEDWPSSVDYASDVYAHHTTVDQFDDSTTTLTSKWEDISGNERHATITGTLDVETLRNAYGPEKAVKVLKGDTSDSIQFHDDLIPPATAALVEGGQFSDSLCSSGSSCIDLSDDVATTTSTFAEWYKNGIAANGTFETRIAQHSYIRTCQDKVISTSECGQHFDVFYPDWELVRDNLDTQLKDVGDGLGGWLDCASEGGTCQCYGTGNVRIGSTDDDVWSVKSIVDDLGGSTSNTCNETTFGTYTGTSTNDLVCQCEATSTAVAGHYILSENGGSLTTPSSSSFLFTNWGTEQNLQSSSLSGNAYNPVLAFFGSNGDSYSGDTSLLEPKCRCIMDLMGTTYIPSSTSIDVREDMNSACVGVRSIPATPGTSTENASALSNCGSNTAIDIDPSEKLAGNTFFSDSTGDYSDSVYNAYNDSDYLSNVASDFLNDNDVDATNQLATSASEQLFSDTDVYTIEDVPAILDGATLLQHSSKTVNTGEVVTLDSIPSGYAVTVFALLPSSEAGNLNLNTSASTATVTSGNGQGAAKAQTFKRRALLSRRESLYTAEKEAYALKELEDAQKVYNTEQKEYEEFEKDQETAKSTMDAAEAKMDEATKTYEDLKSKLDSYEDEINKYKTLEETATKDATTTQKTITGYYSKITSYEKAYIDARKSRDDLAKKNNKNVKKYWNKLDDLEEAEESALDDYLKEMATVATCTYDGASTPINNLSKKFFIPLPVC
eukprot:g1158.t1